MNYIKNKIENQDNQRNCLIIPSTLDNFVNTKTEVTNNTITFFGYIPLNNEDCICPKCNHLTTSNQYHDTIIKHIPIGGVYSRIIIKKRQSACRKCGITFYQKIPFQAVDHFITKELEVYIQDLLSSNNYTIKEISELTGVNRNVIKEIDIKRLKELYTIDGKGKKLIRPTDYSKYLLIDEFKLHNGYKYATHIVDYSTGHILWIAEGKKKQVVYDFINHVGYNWMQRVTAVACDMNSDFEEAFKELCPHIEIVYDRFHIVKYLNEKVIAPIRIEEQNKLIALGDKEAANRLKRTKMILCSSEETLKEKDKKAITSSTVKKETPLFKTNKTLSKGNYYERYQKLVNDNEIFLIIELIKQCLNEAYLTNNEDTMVQLLFDIMELCEASNNKYLNKFKKLIYDHFDGIISHSKYKISTGKIEGINNKIKTLRRQAYGYPDDEYFFLKLIDMSRS